ncbi:hypothetical protein S7335_998 [Synechococcus sp. PCC 7335]|nr:hypothetical protein S7335_998 [Synechococcus sp. PCC 7335]
MDVALKDKIVPILYDTVGELHNSRSNPVNSFSASVLD